MSAIISPEQRLMNVANVVKRYSTPSRMDGGKNGNRYSVDKTSIAQAAHQLADMVEKYLKGELEPLNNDDLPF